MNSESVTVESRKQALFHLDSAMKLTQRVICFLLLFLGWLAPPALFADPGAALFKEKHCALCHNIRNGGVSNGTFYGTAADLNGAGWVVSRWIGARWWVVYRRRGL